MRFYILLSIRIRELASQYLVFWRTWSPPQLFVGSFLLLILLGTLGFKGLPGLYTGPPLSWTDALFTATSAVCVTGLIVVDTATYFTTTGQAYILMLIQLGGLGIITFTTLIISALGGRLSLRHELLTRSVADLSPHVDHRKLTRDVILFTLVMEAGGMILLYALWVPHFGWDSALWHAGFHAVSAFCNAGFSTFSNSLMNFWNEPFVLLVVITLIVIGGVGFLTLEELYLLQKARRMDMRFRLSLHSRLVLVTTGVLLLSGWILFVLFEWHISLERMPLLHKLTNGLFMSVTARTAGFNTIDYGNVAINTNFLTILLMTIGGSPGSTAGGLKTTTVALIGLVAWSRIQGNQVTSLSGRSVPEETIQRAIGLVVVFFILMTGAIFVFTISEIAGATRTDAGRFLPFMFEAVSAFNTVGLSMGVTPDLSGFGRLMTAGMMFLGRVGPLTLAAALAMRQAKAAGRFRYAYEEVGIG